MIQVRKAEERGHFNWGWLDTWHTFSFGEYFDPEHVRFGPLRVINEDFIAGGGGFPMHPHRDMEIVTYVLEGALEHKDSMGNGSVIRPGDVQRMSAGTGIYHSEFNPSKNESTHLLQIWLMPEQRGFKPSYEQTRFENDEKQGRLRLIASRDGRDGSVTIHQDADIFASRLDGQEVAHSLRPGRKAWVQVARGSAALNGRQLKQGDGAGVNGEEEIRMRGDAAEILLFDMA